MSTFFTENIIIGQKAEFEKTISESDVYLFAGITGDMNPLHIDEVMAAQSFVKKNCAWNVIEWDDFDSDWNETAWIWHDLYGAGF